MGRDIFKYSLSLRPEMDTPAALRDYMRQYQLKPGWTFLTGKPAAVDQIRRRLGFYDSDPVADADLARHTGMLRIGNLVRNCIWLPRMQSSLRARVIKHRCAFMHDA